MKRLLILVTGYWLLVTGYCQNDWINYSQQYFRINIVNNGVYRITKSRLLSSGIPVNNFDPRALQVFARGEEQYIYVKGEADGSFDDDDYLEFYAVRNDGWFDKSLYDKPSSQANPDYSLINDTATYYLTWNSSLKNRRMSIENDVSFSSYSPAPFFYKESRQNYTSAYFLGETNQNNVSDPQYKPSSGWFDNAIAIPTDNNYLTTKYIPTPNSYKGGPDALINIVFVGQSNFIGKSPNHHVVITFASQGIDTAFTGYVITRFSRKLSCFNLGASTTDFTFTLQNDLKVGSDRNAVAYISIKYPHTFTLDNNIQNHTMFIPDNPDKSKSYLQLSNFVITAKDTARMYDVTNHKRIKVVRTETGFSCLIPNSNSQKECFLTSDNQINYINTIYPVNKDPNNYAKLIDYKALCNNRADYLIISHSALFQEAQNYQNYRNSTGYKSLLVDVNQLYDQFSYGIRKHPLAIKNFIKYAVKNFSLAPQYVFLLGKAYRAGNEGDGIYYRKNADYYRKTLVPSYGNPPSDELLVSDVSDSAITPFVAVGRLSAKTNSDVKLYLDKVKLYEAAQKSPAEWQKYVLHFGGGTSIDQQQAFSSNLNYYKQLLQDTLFGGYVRTFLKTTSAPIQLNVSDSLKRIINNGVSLLNFFGHAAGIGFDVSLDEPQNYSNYGKYPFLIANSCWAGDIFTDGSITSEAFVLIQDKGVIGFLAAVTQESDVPLHEYSSELIRNIAWKNYGKPIGRCIKNTIENIPTENIDIKSTCLTFTLHADPAISINFHHKPDYIITPDKIFFTPSEVTSQLDSFQVSIIPANVGRAVNKSFVIEVSRTFPDGFTKASYSKKVIAPYFRDTVTFKLPVDFKTGIGLNNLKITLDSYNEISEISELNNAANVSFIIRSPDVTPVYPYQYAVVPDPKITLKASTNDPFSSFQLPASSLKSYVFELDTNASFKSSFKMRQNINHKGGLISWTPNIVLKDSAVYYWRVSLDSSLSPSKSFNWRSSSFQYIKKRNGWAQAHFDQFGNDTYKFVNYNSKLRKFDFVDNIHSLFVQTWYYNGNVDLYQTSYFKVDNTTAGAWSCTSDIGNGMKFAIFDKTTGEPWYSNNQGNGYGQFGNVHCQTYPTIGMDFYTDNATWFNKMTKLIDTVPEGNYVLAFSHRNTNAQNYNEALYKAFESIGSANIRTIKNTIPYIIFGRKGAKIGEAHEIMGASTSSIIQLKDSIKTKWNEGQIESEIIGPSARWISLHWKQVNIDKSPGDSVSLRVIGIKPDGSQVTLIQGLPYDSTDINNLAQRIDAKKYPYLKLIAFMKDNIFNTPPQLKRWQVFYDGIPEIAVDPSAHFYFYKDTVTEGENIKLSLAYTNVSDFPMDSVKVRYWLIDNNRQMHPLFTKRIKPAPANTSIIDSISFNTKGMTKLNSLWFEVNPDFDQPEQYQFNNIGQVYFYVLNDKTNPLLDVTFDGIHILNNDIVSSKPEIQITLNDENKYLALDDTSKLKIFIQPPNSQTPVQIYFRNGKGEDIMNFYPAKLPANTCKIIYKAGFPADGTYRLLVQSKDITGNASGKNDYNIDFRIINKSMISEMLNWPNPFTTQTHFVFTLTGSEIPTGIRIQIMTITGKVVKEIFQNELGPIHIGRNITEYAWDGRDEFGDRLANGVYLYRVTSELKGRSIDRYNTEADKFFTKEFGKMYLIR